MLWIPLGAESLPNPRSPRSGGGLRGLGPDGPRARESPFEDVPVTLTE